MSSFAKTTILGNLTRDPELRYTPKGHAIAKIGVAVNRRWKDAEGNEKVEATFIDCEAFGKTAENIAKFFRKGGPILLEGRLRTDSWEDKQTRAARSKLVVVVEQFIFLPRGKDEPEETQPQEAPEPAEPIAPPAAYTPPKEEDELPF